jgi:hypothetical protein
MITEIDLLREDIPRLEKKFGRDNPFVELLRVQLDFLQNQTAQQPLREQRHMGVVNFIKARIQKREKTSHK